MKTGVTYRVQCDGPSFLKDGVMSISPFVGMKIVLAIGNSLEYLRVVDVTWNDLAGSTVLDLVPNSLNLGPRFREDSSWRVSANWRTKVPAPERFRRGANHFLDEFNQNGATFDGWRILKSGTNWNAKLMLEGSYRLFVSGKFGGVRSVWTSVPKKMERMNFLSARFWSFKSLIKTCCGAYRSHPELHEESTISSCRLVV